MKNKWIKSLLCFIPTIIGLFLWNYLPNTLAIHFGPFGTDRFASKNFVILLVPLMFFIFDIIYTFIIKIKPDWLRIEKQHKITYLFPILSLFVFFLSISNSI